MQTPEPTFEREPHPSQPDEEHSASVPPADKVHAGMFNPWDEATTAPPEAPPEPPTPPPRPRSPSKAPAHARSDEEGVVTSIRPQAPSKPAAPLAPRPPPLPPRAKAPKPPLPRSSSPSETRVQAAPSAPPPVEDVPPSPTTDEDVETSASHHEREPQPPPMTPVPPSPTQQMDLEERERLRRASLPPGEHDRRITRSDEDDAAPRDDGDPNGGPGVAMPDFSAPPPPLVESHVPPAQLDLEGVESFADLPDDARAAFAAAATLSELREAEEVSHFALAYVLRGAFDVSATMVDAAAVRIKSGAVLRARGTTDEGVPMRLVCTGAEGGLVATWSDEAVDEAFRSIPWVEEDLRAAADRVQTLVGITIGPLGERLDVSIREQIVGRLQMRQVLAGEIVVNEGEVVPGLLLVGVGELELVRGDKVTGTVGSGDFLFATEVLGAGNAPATARAGAGGALVLFGDRAIAQELLVTCPPLLEVFAGM
jgi:hypothetical protein